MVSMSMQKIHDALVDAIGKTLDRVFVAERGNERCQLYLVFSDGTSYELYGNSSLNGARHVENWSADSIRRQLSDDGFTFIEIPRPDA